MKHKSLVLTKNGEITSLELLNEINFFRKKDKAKNELAHKTLLGIIRDEFGEEIAEQKILLGSYLDKQKQKRPMFTLTTSQAKQVLVRESKVVRKVIIKRLEELEAQQPKLSIALGYEIKKIPCPRYGEANAYHSDIWGHVYGIDL